MPGRSVSSLIAAGALAVTGGAMADEASPKLMVKLTVNAVTEDSKGMEHLVPVEYARCGDVLVYRTGCRNAGNAPARDVVGSLPLPAGMVEYLALRGDTAAAWASVDGKTPQALPIRRLEIDAKGQRFGHEVPPAKYHKLAWRLGDVPAGEFAIATAHVRLISNRTE